MSHTTIHQTEAPAITAVLYQRVACAPDAENSRGSATQAQQEAVRRKAAELGATIVEEFTDMGVSGLTTNRPGLQQMLAYIDEHDTTYCIVNDLARLARDQSAYEAIRDALTVADVALVTCQDHTCDPSGDGLIQKIMSSVASLSAEDLFTKASARASVRRSAAGRAARVR